MKNIILLFCAFFCLFNAVPGQTSAPATSGQTKYVRPNADKRFKRYVNDAVGPFAWVGMAAGAGFGTIANSPKEWGRSTSGFGKRFASNFGKNVIKTTFIYGLDEAFKLDSHYYRSSKRDVGSRIANALYSTVTARTSNGKRTIGVPQLVGTYSSNLIARKAWYPAGYTWREDAKNSGISLGVTAMINLLTEFFLKK